VFRLLVTGSSQQTNAEIVWNPLFWVVHKHQQMLVVHGGSPTGVDLFVHEWINLPGQKWNADPKSEFLVVEECHDGFWGQPEGGERCNQEMVDAGADACFAFPDDRKRSATLDCVARAWRKGIPTYIFNSTRVGAFHQLTEDEGAALAVRMLGYGS
jgi:YspA, cpYpsA-related SLOG family